MNGKKLKILEIIFNIVFVILLIPYPTNEEGIQETAMPEHELHALNEDGSQRTILAELKFNEHVQTLDKMIVNRAMPVARMDIWNQPSAVIVLLESVYASVSEWEFKGFPTPIEALKHKIVSLQRRNDSTENKNSHMPIHEKIWMLLKSMIICLVIFGLLVGDFVANVLNF